MTAPISGMSVHLILLKNETLAGRTSANRSVVQTYMHDK
jgi:hypothetical protein